MSRWRRRTVAALGLALTLAGSQSARADEYCQKTADPIASVLVIHGGAWMGGEAKDVRDICARLAGMNYRARSLEYPLWTVPGSIDYAQRAAREESARGRPVYATGISAGGSIAAYLAVRSEVDGAVAVAPLSDFVDWRPYKPGFWESLGMTLAMRQRLSPYRNITAPARLRIIHSRDDRVVPYEQSARMVGRCGPACELVTLGLGLGHLSLGSHGPVTGWFAREARNPRFAPARVAGPPVISHASLRPKRLIAAAPVARHRTRRAPRRGVTLGYTLSEGAAVVATIERQVARRPTRSCARPPVSPPSAVCGVWRRVARLTIGSAVGANRVRISGTVGGRALKPGRYRVALVATTPMLRSSRPRYLYFVVRPR